MLSKKDKDLIEKLVNHFYKTGALESEKQGFENLGTTEEILQEAYEIAMSEKELNPDFYNEEVLEEIMNSDPGSDFNPMLDYWEDE